MSRAKNTLLLVRVGIVLLGLASLVHLAEHWETAAMEKCIAECPQSHATSEAGHGDSSQSDHNHGCSAHEHSPAVLQAALPFLPHPIVLASPEETMAAPPSPPRKIDQPPRIS